MAIEQFSQVTQILNQLTLTQGRDKRRSMLLKKNGDLDIPLIYKALKIANPTGMLGASSYGKTKRRLE